MSRSWFCFSCTDYTDRREEPRACDNCDGTRLKLKGSKGTISELGQTIHREQGKAATDVQETTLRLRLRKWLRSRPTENDLFLLRVRIKDAVRDAEWRERNRPAQAAGE